VLLLFFVFEEEALEGAWPEGGVAVCLDDGRGVHRAVVAVAGEDAFVVGEEGVLWGDAAVREGAFPLGVFVFPGASEPREAGGADGSEGREEAFDAGDGGSREAPRVEEVPEEFVDVVLGAVVVGGGDMRGGREPEVDDEDVGSGFVDEEVAWVEIVVDDLAEIDIVRWAGATDRSGGKTRL